ncbi:putative 7 kDa protein [Rose yellow leaf virus]|nr:putative 7 kDa protein [Rose yellow leaf virus]
MQASSVPTPVTLLMRLRAASTRCIASPPDTKPWPVNLSLSPSLRLRNRSFFGISLLMVPNLLTVDPSTA